MYCTMHFCSQRFLARLRGKRISQGRFRGWLTLFALFSLPMAVSCKMYRRHYHSMRDRCMLSLWFYLLVFQTRYLLKFEQIYLSKPTHWEKDGAPSPLMPNEARLRNLTYVVLVLHKRPRKTRCRLDLFRKEIRPPFTPLFFRAS